MAIRGFQVFIFFLNLNEHQAKNRIHLLIKTDCCDNHLKRQEA